MPGDKDAYTFKILELSELRTITVLDSINHIKADFNIEHHKELEYQERLLQFITRLETAIANNRFVSENEKAKAVRKIENQQKVVDSLRAVTVSPLIEKGSNLVK